MRSRCFCGPFDWLLLHSCPVQAIEQKRQFAGAETNGSSVNSRPDKTPILQNFGQQNHAAAIPNDHLQTIVTLAAEDIYVA